jgi:hypothetical protein
MRLQLQTEPDGSLPVAPKRAPRTGPPLKYESNTPDFGIVYGFLADLFKVNEARTDSDRTLSAADSSVKSLEHMTAIDRDTALLLIRNIRSNMCSKQMWQQQSDLLQDGCATFLDAEDAKKFQYETGKTTDASPEDNTSGDGGSGGASNEGL